MIYILEVIVIILQGVILYKLFPKVPPPAVEPVRDETITLAIEKAFKGCGLNADEFHMNFNLLPTGKLGNILYHAAEELGKPIKTVQDIHDLLVK